MSDFMQNVLKKEFQTALNFYKQGMFENAKNLYLKILKIHPDDFESITMLGLLYSQTGNFELALQYFDRAIELNSLAAKTYFYKAEVLFQDSKIDLSINLYKKTIEIEPKYLDAYLKLGEIYINFRRYEDAIKIYDRAIRFYPKNFILYHLKADVFSNSGKNYDAIKFYEKSINLNPKFALSYNNRAVVYKRLLKLGKALADYKKAIMLSPNSAEIHYNIGNLEEITGKYESALVSYDNAIALLPNFFDAYYNKGNILFKMKHYNNAIENFELAILLNPNLPDAHYGKGNALSEIKLYDQAIENYDKAISLKTDYAEAYYNRGNAFKNLNRLDEALTNYDKAISLKTDYAEAYNNRGYVLKDLNRLDEALTNYDKAISLKTDYAEAYNNRGNVLKDLNRLDEALTNYDKAISLKRDYSDALLNKALLCLLTGDFEQGWKLYENRDNQDIQSSQPVWKGEEILNKTILVYNEQGLGDTIQFCRYLPMLIEHGAKILFAPQKSLQSLMRSLDNRIEIVDLENRSLIFDYRISLMSLPKIFHNLGSNFYSRVPYLSAEKSRIEYWKAKLDSSKFQVGICWKGNSKYKDDGNRSFSVSKFHSISRIPNIKLFSLHKGEGESELEFLPNGMIVENFQSNFDTDDQAFRDTAAIMENLDLIITSDTSIAHLAGALGRPTWVLLGNVPDWRWFLDIDESPWYPTLRLFRQKLRGDWESVFKEIEFNLKNMLV